MAYYRKRSYSRRKRNTRLRKQIKSVMLRNLETKKLSTEAELTKASYHRDVDLVEFIEQYEGSFQRNGQKVILSGVGFEIIADNTQSSALSDVNDQPLFVSWALISGKKDVMANLDTNLFKVVPLKDLTVLPAGKIEIDKESTGFPTTGEINGDKYLAAKIHTWSINTGLYRVLKRGNFRMGTAKNDSIVGPTFHHIKGYCPVRMPIHWNGPIPDTSVRLVAWVTDPTQSKLAGKSAPVSAHKILLKGTVYFKDV